jgi:hypothetical protein
LQRDVPHILGAQFTANAKRNGPAVAVRITFLILWHFAGSGRPRGRVEIASARCGAQDQGRSQINFSPLTGRLLMLMSPTRCSPVNESINHVVRAVAPASKDDS